MTAPDQGFGLSGSQNTDAQRVVELRRMKAVPLALLIFAAAVYLVARYAEAQPEASQAWGYVRAMAEAGVVGGLADWFAVTAIFRHPLGIPIPHTALIPKKKDQLGASLSTFVRENFLQPDTVRSRVARAEPGRMLSGYLGQPANRDRLVAELAALGESALDGVKDAEVQLFVRNTVFSHAASTAWSPILGRTLDAVVADRNHTRVVDVVLEAGRVWLSEHREDMVELIADQGPLSQRGPIRWAHELVAAEMHKSALEFMTEACADPEHGARASIDDALTGLADRLQHDMTTIERVETWKLDLLEHEQTQRAVTELWPTLRGLLVRALRDPDSDLRQRMDTVLLDLSVRLDRDEDYRATFDERVESGAVFLTERYGTEAVTVISETVQRWDGGEASRRIELAVGRDLQFIRINGTVVGALAGLTIHTVSQLLI